MLQRLDPHPGDSLAIAALGADTREIEALKFIILVIDTRIKRVGRHLQVGPRLLEVEVTQRPAWISAPWDQRRMPSDWRLLACSGSRKGTRSYPGAASCT